MKQDINDLKAGQTMIVVKNEDGSFSPLGITANCAIILRRLLSSLSESETFVVNEKVKLVLEKHC